MKRRVAEIIAESKEIWGHNRGRVAALGLTLPLLLGACGDDESEQTGSASASAPATEGNTPSSGASSESGVRLTFDDLDDKADAVIQVYPGVSSIEAHKISNGTFNPGDVVAALCKTTGRVVESHPENGDDEKTSDQWVRISGSPGKTQYASLTYAQIDQAALQGLREC